MTAAALTVILAVPDVAEAVLFYRKLGFGQTFAIPDPEGKVVHSEMAIATSTIMLGPLHLSHYQSEERSRMLQRGPRGLGATLMLAVDDVNAMADVIRGEQVEILLEPVDEFYGQRVCFFIDPFGYEWKLTQTCETVDRDEVVRRATGKSSPTADLT